MWQPPGLCGERHIHPAGDSPGRLPAGFAAVVDVGLGVVEGAAVIDEKVAFQFKPEAIAVDRRDVIGHAPVDDLLEDEQVRTLHLGRPAAAGGQVEREGPHAPGNGGVDRVYRDGTPGDAGVPGRAAGDRKSTRLNSSHMSISYAVFCLKKKKKYQKNLLVINKKKTQTEHK